MTKSKSKRLEIDNTAPRKWTVRFCDEANVVREVELSGQGPWDVSDLVRGAAGQNTGVDDLRRLAWSIRGALVQCGVEPACADSLYDVVTSVIAVVPTPPAQTPEGAEIDRLITALEVEMKRSATNLGTILRTACRDMPLPVLAAQLDDAVRMHVRCELVMIEMLMGMKRTRTVSEQQAPAQN